MEIHLNTEFIKVARSGDAAPNAPHPAAKSGEVSLEQSQALNRSLAQVPDVRPEAVQRGKELVASPNYPPPVMMEKIARLLAIQEQTQSSSNS